MWWYINMYVWLLCCERPYRAHSHTHQQQQQHRCTRVHWRELWLDWYAVVGCRRVVLAACLWRFCWFVASRTGHSSAAHLFREKAFRCDAMMIFVFDVRCSLASVCVWVFVYVREKLQTFSKWILAGSCERETNITYIYMFHCVAVCWCLMHVFHIHSRIANVKKGPVGLLLPLLLSGRCRTIPTTNKTHDADSSPMTVYVLILGCVRFAAFRMNCGACKWLKNY